MRTLILACLVTALALTACSEGDDTGTDAAATTTTEADQSTTTTVAEPATTTTAAETTTTTAAKATTTEQASDRLPIYPGVAEPGTYAAQAGMTHFQLTLASPAIVEADANITSFWPEPPPPWMEYVVEEEEEEEEEEDEYGYLPRPIFNIHPVNNLYPDGDSDSKVPAAEVEDLAAFLADHPAFLNPTEPAFVSIVGQDAIRVETGFVGDFGDCGTAEYGGADFVCTLGASQGWVNQGVPDTPDLDPEQRFRIDFIAVGDRVILLQTRLCPNAADESRAYADAIIDGIGFPST